MQPEISPVNYPLLMQMRLKLGSDRGDPTEQSSPERFHSGKVAPFSLLLLSNLVLGGCPPLDFIVLLFE